MLEPYAVRQQWRLPGQNPDWPAFLGEYLTALAQACTAAGAPVLGHIKALALFPNGGYFRISVVDARRPPTTEGALPANLSALDLTLNLIVYGLEAAALQRITTETGAQLAEKHHGEVTEQIQTHSHHSHHSI